MTGTEPYFVAEHCRESLVRAGLLDFAAVMSRTEGEPVKAQLTSRQVHRLRLDDGRVVYLKRYFAIPFIDALRDRLLGRGYDSGIERERLALTRLAEIGISAPQVLVAAEDRSGGLVRSGYLVTRGLPVRQSLETWLREGAPSNNEIEEALVFVAMLVKRMHEQGVNHRDLYLAHLMIDEAPVPVHVMDLNRADCRKVVPRRWRVKDLAALQVSTPRARVSLRQRLIFLRLYLGEDLRRHRDLIRAIDRKAARMRRHIEKQIARGHPNFHLDS